MDGDASYDIPKLCDPTKISISFNVILGFPAKMSNFEVEGNGNCLIWYNNLFQEIYYTPFSLFLVKDRFRGTNQSPDCVRWTLGEIYWNNKNAILHDK